MSPEGRLATYHSCSWVIRNSIPAELLPVRLNGRMTLNLLDERFLQATNVVRRRWVLGARREESSHEQLLVVGWMEWTGAEVDAQPMDATIVH